MCEITTSHYKKFMHENLTRDYKLDNTDKLTKINEETKEHAQALNIIDRMEIHSESNAFLTDKDHKQGFPNNIKCRANQPSLQQTRQN